MDIQYKNGLVELIGVKRYIRKRIKECEEEKKEMLLGNLDYKIFTLDGQAKAFKEILDKLELINNEDKIRKNIM